MPSRVPISSAVRDGAEEAGQRGPPTQARSEVPKVSMRSRGVSHLAQLPSEKPFPLVPQLQIGQQGRREPQLRSAKSPFPQDSGSQYLC